jgi:hypothetical protein
VLRKYSARRSATTYLRADEGVWHDADMLVLALIAHRLIEDSIRWALLLCRSTNSIRAENLFLRRQLALYIERGVRPRRIDAATRVSLALLARRFDWRSSLVVVKPATLLRWHRAGWRWFWRLKSQPGRPAIPKDLQSLIRLWSANIRRRAARQTA